MRLETKHFKVTVSDGLLNMILRIIVEFFR